MTPQLTIIPSGAGSLIWDARPRRGIYKFGRQRCLLGAVKPKAILVCSTMTALLTCGVIACGAANLTLLEPNAQWSLYFPELPDTLATMWSSQRQPARLTVQLPANYSRDGKFPLFVFLNGGDGGRGDTLPLDRRTVGSNDFICVNLPLFKHTDSTNDDREISMDDFQTLSQCYRVMLQKLFDKVPNIMPKRSALGGFSNGGHAVGVLLAGQDAFILSHFRAFYLAEGGFGPLAANALRKDAMKPCRFLLLRGERADDDTAKSKGEREHNTHLAQALELEAQEFNLDFTVVTMRNIGHDLPRKYQAILGAWVHGESVSH